MQICTDQFVVDSGDVGTLLPLYALASDRPSYVDRRLAKPIQTLENCS